MSTPRRRKPPSSSSSSSSPSKSLKFPSSPPKTVLNEPDSPLYALADALPGPLSQLARYAANLLVNRAYFDQLAMLLLVWEAILCAVVIWKVPYTEIDWIAYMQEVSGFLSGERDYTKLKGDTGPLVYPAGFVYLYSGLYWITGNGENLLTGQWVFAGLYLGSLAVVMLSMRGSKVIPNYALIFLTLSKRLHSIYVLRLFNDPWAMFFVYLSIHAMTSARWRASAIFYSLGVSIKMNALLFAPAFGILHLLANGLTESIINGLSFILVQIFFSLPFTLHDAGAYLSRSFELTRVFLYKWSTNWKFVPEPTFLSSGFARTLLAAHALLLVLYLLKWTAGVASIGSLFSRKPGAKGQQPSTDTIIAFMFTSNLVGILCARSLHYQFYSWYAWTVPYLLWFAELERPISFLLRRDSSSLIARMAADFIRIAAWAVLEASWNVYPATSKSSLAMLVVNAGMVVSCWVWGRWAVARAS